MFTANSMNCLVEALGLGLPGNGSVLATHAKRRALFERAGSLVIELAKRYYEGDDESALPRSIATPAAFGNAMALDVAMGGSTNTVLHLLAAAQEAGVGFGLKEIDATSRRVPCIAKVAPNVATYYMEDVHRAGGIPAILGELRRGACSTEAVHAVHSADARRLAGTSGTSAAARLDERPSSFPRGSRRRAHRREPFSTATAGPRSTLTRPTAASASVAHAYTKDGGLAVLWGNIAPEGAVVKTAGVEESIWTFSGPARVFESQDAACDAILGRSRSGRPRHPGPELLPGSFLDDADKAKHIAAVDRCGEGGADQPG